MRYDIKLLKDGLQDVKKTRDILIGNLFPSDDWTEIDKIDTQIHRLEKSIKILQDDTH